MLQIQKQIEIVTAKAGQACQYGEAILAMADIFIKNHGSGHTEGGRGVKSCHGKVVT